MKKLFFLLILMLATSYVSAQTDSIDVDWVRRNYQKREIMIPMRDGVRLFTTIYEPSDKRKEHPILMNRTCYSVAPYGEDKYMGLHREAWREYVRSGYILVFQDVRGKNKSEGKFEDIRPFVIRKTMKPNGRNNNLIDEASDTYDTTDWLIHNTHNNGKVGVFGISYPGFYSTMAAICGHPAIKAVSPQAPVTDWYRGDDDHHNGAMCLLDMFSFEHWFEYVNVASNRDSEWGFKSTKSPANMVRTDAYNDYLKMGAIKNFSVLYGDSVEMWNSTMNHPYLDAWWETRNVVYHCHDVKPAVMVVGGLFDAEDCYGAFSTYKAIRKLSPTTDLYLVEGPWAHGMWGRGARSFFGDVYVGDSAASAYYLKNVEIPFFAYYLEGKGSKPKSKVRIYRTGENCWTDYDADWSGKSKRTPIYMNDGGKLSFAQQPSDVSASYLSDPHHPVPFASSFNKEREQPDLAADQRFTTSRPDVAVFQTETLTKPVRLSGELEADLSVSLTTDDADFIVKLVDVFPDDFRYPDSIMTDKRGDYVNMGGYQMLVRGEIMRGKFRNAITRLDDNLAKVTDSKGRWSGKAYSAYLASIEHVGEGERFVPSEVTNVKFLLPDVAHTFLPGHKIMVIVQSTCFPRFDINPQRFCDIYHCSDSDFQPCTVTIHNSKEHPSRIWLPIE